MATQIISAILGVWLMVAPAVLGHAGSTLATFDRIIGPTIAAVSFVAAAQITRSVRWINLPAAAVLLIAPWFFDAPLVSTLSSAGSALVVLALTPWGSPDQTRYGNGWTTLWRAEDLPDWDVPRASEHAA
ncbi:hypothetical protein BH23ACT10_BH23ACT10_37230 [soil metagenome]